MEIPGSFYLGVSMITHTDDLYIDRLKGRQYLNPKMDILVSKHHLRG
jgi:hypothetical protein